MLIDTALLIEGSSGAIPFSTFITLVVLWLGVSTPLVFIGSHFGFKKDEVVHPVRTNTIPRQVPPQPWYMHPALTVTFGGILPFGAVSVELFFIMSALWLHQIYYIFGFLFLVMIILVATCAEITILMCYFQLCNEDTAGGGASSRRLVRGYIFCYSVWYYITELSIDGFVPTCLYFGHEPHHDHVFPPRLDRLPVVLLVHHQDLRQHQGRLSPTARPARPTPGRRRRGARSRPRRPQQPLSLGGLASPTDTRAPHPTRGPRVWRAVIGIMITNRTRRARGHEEAKRAPVR